MSVIVTDVDNNIIAPPREKLHRGSSYWTSSTQTNTDQQIVLDVDPKHAKVTVYTFFYKQPESGLQPQKLLIFFAIFTLKVA